LGTPQYMPPEQWSDATSVTPASDVYALGCTLFALLAGRPPYQTDNIVGLMHSHMRDPIPSIRTYRPDAPPGLEAVLKKALQKRPADRFQSAAEFGVALQAFVQIGQRASLTSTKPTVGNGPSRFSQWMLPAALLVGATAVAGIGYFAVANGWTSSLFATKETAPPAPSTATPITPATSTEGAAAPPLFDPTAKLREYRETHAAVWPDESEFNAAVSELSAGGSAVDSLEDWRVLEEALTKETRRLAEPFGELGKKSDLNERQKASATAAAQALETLSRLHAKAPSPELAVAAGFVDGDGRPVASAKPHQKVYIEFRLKQAGFVTLVQFDDWTMLALPTKRNWPAGTMLRLPNPFSFDAAGVKIFHLYVAERAIFDR
ncbi:MAG: serine/threonine protein kinase, partial [Planctomycetia bacterium]